MTETNNAPERLDRNKIGSSLGCSPRVALAPLEADFLSVQDYGPYHRVLYVRADLLADTEDKLTKAERRIAVLRKALQLLMAYSTTDAVHWEDEEGFEAAMNDARAALANTDTREGE
jgi:hypothetical protein